LAAAEVVHVRVVWNPLADSDLVHIKAMSAPFEPSPQHGDVAAIGIDIQLTGIQMADPDRTHPITRVR
jgi:hypothetical protein